MNAITRTPAGDADAIWIDALPEAIRVKLTAEEPVPPHVGDMDEDDDDDGGFEIIFISEDEEDDLPN